MDKKVFVSFLTFGLITVVLFFGGTIGTILTVKHVNKIRELEKSEKIKEAVITRIESRSRTPNSTIYFVAKNDINTYRMHLLKLVMIRAKVGDELKVKFNNDRTMFLITNYQTATYISYAVQIGLFIVCFLLSILFLRGTIDLYKYIRSK